jgi:SprA-related family
MEPIKTTNSAKYYQVIPSEKARQQFDSAKGISASSPQTVENKQSKASPAVEVKLGKNSTENKQPEFKLYNTEGRLEGDKQNDKSALVAKDEQTALPDQKANEDPQIQQIISQLKATEEKVKAHEAAHKSSGAATGPISYTYTRGPDGKSYITGGEVPINLSTGSTPEETIGRMQQVIQAALAPADPSPQDRAVASQASNIKLQAQQEKAQQSNGQKTGDLQAETAGTAPAPNQENTVDDTKSTKENSQSAAGNGQKISHAQSRSAYTDPAVKGKPDFLQMSANQSEKQNTSDNVINIIQQTGSRQPSSGITTEMISGFASAKAVSFYA